MAVKRKTKKAELSGPQLQAVAELFAVLSEPSRLRILQLLESQPASVSEIVVAAGMKQANVSKQLGILHQAGVVSRQKDGNIVRYSIRLPLVFDLCALVCNAMRQEALSLAKSLTS